MFVVRMAKSVIKKLLILVVVTFIASGSLYYVFIYKPKHQVKLVTNVILEQTTKQSFLVLGNKLSNITVQKAENNQGWLKSLLLKHVVSVQGNVKVFYGLNINKDSFTKKVYYNTKKNCVVIKLGKPVVLASEIQFPIHYKTESGIVYKAFSEDKEKDINDMLSLLKTNAESSTTEWLKTQDIQELSAEFAKQVKLLTNNKTNICIE